jgi:hypothetical protein
VRDDARRHRVDRPGVPVELVDERARLALRRQEVVAAVVVEVRERAVERRVGDGLDLCALVDEREPAVVAVEVLVRAQGSDEHVEVPVDVVVEEGDLVVVDVRREGGLVREGQRPARHEVVPDRALPEAAQGDEEEIEVVVSVEIADVALVHASAGGRDQRGLVREGARAVVQHQVVVAAAVGELVRAEEVDVEVPVDVDEEHVHLPRLERRVQRGRVLRERPRSVVAEQVGSPLAPDVVDIVHDQVDVAVVVDVA